MGKNLIETNTTSTAGQPIGAETLDFIQGAWNDPITALLKAVVGSYTTNDVIIIEGCKVTTGSPTSAGACTITSGVIYLNGVWYAVDSFSGTITGSNVIVGTITTSDAVGPVQFTDGNSYSIHEIKRIVLTQALTGTADFDFSTFKNLSNGRSFLSATASSQTISSTSYIDLTSITVTTPNDNKNRLYMVFFKSRTDQSGSSGTAYLEFQILVDGVQKDVTSAGRTAATTEIFLMNANMMYFGTVEPNKIIKVQAKKATGQDCTVYDMKLYAVEIF